VNKEYQNQIILQLKKITEWLLSQIAGGDSGLMAMHEQHVAKQVDLYLKHREQYGKSEVIGDLFPYDPNLLEQYQKAKIIKHDPFLPKDIRESIANLLETRFEKMVNVWEEVTDAFVNDLDKESKIEDSSILFWGELTKGYYDAKVGFSDIEEKNIEVVRQIEDYLVNL
jgi:hypothetical protein